MKKTIKVDGMTCGNCSKAVTERLMELEGMEKVEVNLDTKEVDLEGSKIDIEEIKTAIDEIGFDFIE